VLVLSRHMVVPVQGLSAGRWASTGSQRNKQPSLSLSPREKDLWGGPCTRPAWALSPEHSKVPQGRKAASSLTLYRGSRPRMSPSANFTFAKALRWRTRAALCEVERGRRRERGRGLFITDGGGSKKGSEQTEFRGSNPWLRHHWRQRVWLSGGASELTKILRYSDILSKKIHSEFGSKSPSFSGSRRVAVSSCMYHVACLFFCVSGSWCCIDGHESVRGGGGRTHEGERGIILLGGRVKSPTACFRVCFYKEWG